MENEVLVNFIAMVLPEQNEFWRLICIFDLR